MSRFLRYITRPVSIHVLVWLLAYMISFYFFSNVTDVQTSLAKSAITISVFVLIFYINTLYLIPKYFESGRYSVYILMVVLVIILATGLRYPIEAYLLSSKPQFARPNIVGLLPALSVFTTVLLTIISTTIKLSQNAVRYRQQQRESENKQLEAELNFLKAQINPHFLFNTLNNIYTLAYLKSDQAADMIAKLSELMRYMIYEATIVKVPLKKEITFLQNYVSLYQLKYGNQKNLIFEVIGEKDWPIEPMLFIPMVENCFKYADLDTSGGFIKIKLEMLNNSLIFSTINSIDRKPTVEDHNHGIGLKNMEQRLNLLYPHKNQLDIRSKDGKFEVSVRLEMA